MKLLSEYKLGGITLKNRVVMAPMTRSRAIGNVPNELMAEYYAQRADGGLLITEGVAPSPNGLGYARIPGLFSQEQIAGWKKVTDAVHAKGGKIFAQLMHTGRIGHKDNLPEGAEIVGPSAITAKGQMWTDGGGMQDHPEPKEIATEDIAKTADEYVQAAKNAIEAGFDGIELHGANGYLLDQFINPGSNQRTDEYGGSVENRARFVIEVAKKTAEAIGADKTGIRLSPYGAFNDLFPFEGINIVDHSSMGAPEVPESLKATFREVFPGTIIYSGGLTKESAEERLQQDDKGLAAFGKPYLAHPDLVSRFEHNAPLNNDLKMDLFYTPGAEGYTDYPAYSLN